MLRQKEGLLHRIYSSSEQFNGAIEELLRDRFARPKHTLAKRVVLYLMIVFGAIWGVPWMESAAQAVTALGIESEVVQMLARIGIVLAVGVDGVWIMLTIHEVVFPSYRTKLKLRKAYRHQSKVLLVSVVLAILSCIPGVYAAYLYNNGPQQYLAIITFFGNLGLATFGFFTILFEVTKKVFQPKDEPSSIEYQAKLYSMYHTVIVNQDTQSEPILPLTTTTYEEFVKYIESEHKNYYPEDFGAIAHSIMLIVPLIFAIVVASSQSLIDIVLTTDFFSDRLQWEEVVSIVLACIFAIPNLIVSFLSSREVASKIINTAFCRKKYNYLEHFHKKLTVLIAVLAFLVSLFAPTSACYIVYTSLKKVNESVAVASTISILLARLCFSNYTCRVLFYKLTVVAMGRSRPTQDTNIQHIFRLLERVHPENYLLVGSRIENNDVLQSVTLAV